jgi:hypothetical protein
MYVRSRSVKSVVMEEDCCVVHLTSFLRILDKVSTWPAFAALACVDASEKFGAIECIRSSDVRLGWRITGAEAASIPLLSRRGRLSSVKDWVVVAKNAASTLFVLYNGTRFALLNGSQLSDLPLVREDPPKFGEKLKVILKRTADDNLVPTPIASVVHCGYFLGDGTFFTNDEMDTYRKFATYNAAIAQIEYLKETEGGSSIATLDGSFQGSRVVTHAVGGPETIDSLPVWQRKSSALHDVKPYTIYGQKYIAVPFEHVKTKYQPKAQHVYTSHGLFVTVSSFVVIHAPDLPVYRVVDVVTNGFSCVRIDLLSAKPYGNNVFVNAAMATLTAFPDLKLALHYRNLMLCIQKHTFDKVLPGDSIRCMDSHWRTVVRIDADSAGKRTAILCEDGRTLKQGDVISHASFPKLTSVTISSERFYTRDKITLTLQCHRQVHGTIESIEPKGIVVDGEYFALKNVCKAVRKRVTANPFSLEFQNIKPANLAEPPNAKRQRTI